MFTMNPYTTATPNFSYSAQERMPTPSLSPPTDTKLALILPPTLDLRNYTPTPSTHTNTSRKNIQAQDLAFSATFKPQSTRTRPITCSSTGSAQPSHDESTTSTTLDAQSSTANPPSRLYTPTNNIAGGWLSHLTFQLQIHCIENPIQSYFITTGVAHYLF